MTLSRNRLYYSIFIVMTILLGFGSRMFSAQLPHFVALYAGDTLWGLMVFLGFGFILKDKNGFIVALVALLFSVAIETSQLYHAPWIDAIRQYKLAGLVLGYGFSWSDIICYMTGIYIGFVAETIGGYLKLTNDK